MSRDETIRLAAILATQGNFRFYIVSMPSDVLRDTCFTITREADPIEGFQRSLDERRAEAIAEYIDHGVGSIPTAIILSAQDEAELSYSTKSKTIAFKRAERSFIIIDGQHRVWGFMKAKSSIRVPAVIYDGLTRVEEAQLFIDINENQIRVPQSLILDVKRLLQSETEDERRCSVLFDLFESRSDSALKGCLARAEHRRGKLLRTAFNDAVSEILRRDLHECPPDKSYSIMNNYLMAVRRVFAEIDDSLAKAITRPVVFKGVMTVARYVIDKTLDRHNKLTQDAFYDVLKVLKDNLPKESISRPGNSPRRFSGVILEALSKVYLRPSIITEE